MTTSAKATTTPSTRVRIASVSSCSTFVDRKQIFAKSSSSSVDQCLSSKRCQSNGTASLNVDAQRSVPLQSLSVSHHSTFVRRADGSTAVKLIVPSAGSASLKAQRAAGERSTRLLVGIVVVFLVCHVVRLVIQIDAVVHPSTIGGRHFQYCQIRGRLHSPVAVWILTSFNVFCLVLVSQSLLIDQHLSGNV